MTGTEVLAMLRDETMPFDADAVASFVEAQEGLLDLVFEGLDLEADEGDVLPEKLKDVRQRLGRNAELVGEVERLESQLSQRRSLLCDRIVCQMDLLGRDESSIDRFRGRSASMGFEELDAVAVAWNPAINLESFSAAHSQRARHMGEILYSVPNNLMRLKAEKDALLTQQVMQFRDGSKLSIYYVTHHLAHAAAFFYSPFDRAAIMSIDAFGERQCVLFAEGKGITLQAKWSQDFPHSLGAFYSTMTEFLGFSAQRDEWKLMGASAFGDPTRYAPQLSQLIAPRKAGGFELDLRYFNHFQFPRAARYTPKLGQLLGLTPNPSGQPLTQPYYDLAAAAQHVYRLPPPATP